MSRQSIFLFTTASFLACVADNNINCIVNTGGGCASAPCYAWRGPTQCNAGRCFCSQRTCAVVSDSNQEVCEHVEYERPFNETHFRLRNSRWPDYYIDVDSFGSVDVENRGDNEDDNKFTLYMPTSKKSAVNTKNLIFLLASVKWKDSVLRVYKGGSSDRRFQTALQNVNGGLRGLVPDPSIAEIGMKISIAPKGMFGPNGTERRPLMLSSYNWPNEFLYCTTFRWSVDVHREDPGAGGYWWFEPPLPDELVAILPHYTGKRCSINCGEVSAAGSSRNILLASLATSFSLIFWPRIL